MSSRLENLRKGAAAESGFFLEERTATSTLLAEARGIGRLLFVVTLVAAVLRFTRLTASEVWLDEVLVYNDAKNGTHVTVSSSHDFHLKLVGWILNHISDSAFGLRLWSAIAGTLAAPVMALAGRWMRNERLACVCGLFGALSPFMIFYSQDGNYYGAMALFGAIILAAYVAFFRGATVLGLALLFSIAIPAHKNHPLISPLTGFALGGCVLGSSIYPGLRHHIWKRGWRLLVPGILLIACLLAMPAVWKPLTAKLNDAFHMVSLGDRPPGVEFTFSFFTKMLVAYGVSYHRPIPGAEVLAWLVFAACLDGIVSLVKRTRTEQPALPVVGLFLLTTIASLVLVFNNRHHGFYPRYLTHLVPIYLVIIACFVESFGAWLSTRLQKNPAHVLIGVGLLLPLIQLPNNVRYLIDDRANFRRLGEELEVKWKEGEPIYLPARIDEHQSKYYLTKTTPAYWPDKLTQLYTDSRLSHRTASELLHKLYGQKSAWIIHAWGAGGFPGLMQFLEQGVPKEYEGRSPSGDVQNARLYHWQFEDRVMMKLAATRFHYDAHGSAPVLVDQQGMSQFKIVGADWKINTEFKRLNPDFFDMGKMKSIFAIRTLKLPPGFDTAEIEATPTLPTQLWVSPFDTINWTEDNRCSEGTVENMPVMNQMFDTVFSYLLWVPQHEQRQFILKVIGDPGGDQFAAVACDGVHLGTWRFEKSDKQLLRIPTNLQLPDGNHRIDISVFRLGLGYSPFRKWQWPGFEWSVGDPAEGEQSLENSSPESFGALPQPVVDWGPAGQVGLTKGYNILPPSYDVRVSSTVTGPSGRPALEIDLTKPLHGPDNAYCSILTPFFPARPGTIVPVATYLKAEGTTTHAISMYRAFVDKDGNLMPHSSVANQQLLLGKYSHGWTRYVDFIPVPEGAAAMATGIIIFPPDEKKVELVGTIHVDAMMSMTTFKGPVRETELDGRLFWKVE